MTSHDNHSPQEQGAFTKGAIVFDRFEILGVISSGAKGRVYKAQDTLLQNIVALKVLIADQKSDRDFVRFQTEARLASKMKHPNIATIYDFGLSGNTPFLSMEFVEGESLEAFLEANGTIPLLDFYEIFLQVCAAIEHAHKHGIVHRDIKPANIVLSENPSGGIIVKVLDFGIAKNLEIVEEEGGRLTPTGNILGSPNYMSPEQCQGTAVTTKSDNYSLGCVMWECLAGEPPFSCKTAMETIWHHASAEPGSLREHVEDPLPDRLCELIDGLLSKQPEARPSLTDTVIPTLESLSGECDDEPSSRRARDTTSGDALVGPKPGKSARLAIALAILGVIAAAAAVLNVSRSLPQPATMPAAQISLGAYSDLPDNFDQGIGTRYDQAIEEARAGRRKELRLNYGFSDDHMKQIGSLPQVDKLDLCDSAITDNALQYLGKLQQLTDLAVNRSKVKTLADLPVYAKNLRRFQCKKTNVDDDALKQVARLKHLDCLALDGCTKVTNKGVRELTVLGKLNTLDLSGTKVTKEVIPSLKKMNGLSVLLIRNTGLDEGAIREILRIPTLILVDFQNSGNLSKEQIDQIMLDFPTVTVAPNRKSTVAALIETGQAAAAGNDPLKALDSYHRIVQLIEKRYGPDSDSLPSYLNRCGELAGQLKQPVRANQFFDRAVRIALLHDNSKEILISALKAKCNLNSKLKDYPSGIEAHEQLLKHVERMENPNIELLAYTTQSLGNLYRESGQFGKAMKAYQNAQILVDRRFGPRSDQKGTVLMSIGECYRLQEKYTEAETYFKKARRILEQNELNNKSLLATYAGLSAVEHFRKHYKQALLLNDKALLLATKNKVPAISESSLLKERAVLLERVGRAEEAEPLLERARRLDGLSKNEKP